MQGEPFLQGVDLTHGPVTAAMLFVMSAGLRPRGNRITEGWVTGGPKTCRAKSYRGLLCELRRPRLEELQELIEASCFRGGGVHVAGVQDLKGLT